MRAADGTPHRPRLSHRPLGGRPPHAGGRADELARLECHALRRLRHRSLRRPHAGHDGHDGQPRLPQRRGHRLPPSHPLAAHPQGRPRRRHLRQGPARHDDGAGRHARSALRARARRRHAAARPTARTPARSRRIGARFAHGELSRSRRPPSWAAAPAARRAAAASSSAPPPPRRSSARRSASRCRIRRSRPRASRSGSTWPAAPPAPWSACRPAASPRATSSRTRRVRNAMVVHAAFGGSTNLLLHLPAIAHAAGLRRPTVDDWIDINRRVPRLVDALPNGPRNHPTVRVFLAGGVPEVMLHLRRAGPARTGCASP